MPILGDSAHDIVGTIRGIVGLSRSGRIREQIEHTVDLYEKVSPHGPLNVAADDLRAVLEHQTGALRRLADPAVKTGRDWATFVLGIVFLVLPLAALTYWGYTFTDAGHWWAWVWTVAAGLTALLFLIATCGVMLESKES